MANKDYYPPTVRQLQTVNTQIEEFETVVFRNDLEMRIAKETDTNYRQLKEEADINNSRVIPKLDTLYKVRDELQKELGVEA